MDDDHYIRLDLPCCGEGLWHLDCFSIVEGGLIMAGHQCTQVIEFPNADRDVVDCVKFHMLTSELR